MNHTLYIFIEAIAMGHLDYQGTAMIVRRNGKIFDYVLEGEPVSSNETVAEERLVDVIGEISKYGKK